jgi:hypothetical protein
MAISIEKMSWSLPLPSKVLHFLWLVTTYTLPLRMKLHHRGIKLDTRCPLCFRFNEDGGHCFLKCKKVKGVWRQVKLEHIMTRLIKCPNSYTFMDEVFNLDEDEKIKTCLLL